VLIIIASDEYDQNYTDHYNFFRFETMLNSTCRQLSCPDGLSCVDLQQGGFECVGSTTFNMMHKVVYYFFNDTNKLPLNDSIQLKIRTR